MKKYKAGGGSNEKDKLIQSELNRFNGKTGAIATRMIERSRYGINSDFVKQDLRSTLEKSETGAVNINYYSLKSNIGTDGFADVEVGYDVTKSQYTGSKDLFTGKANMSTSSTKKYKIIRTKLMDFSR